MKRSLLLLALVASSCVPPTKPVTPPPVTPPASIAFDLVACKNAIADNYCDGPAQVVFTLTPTSVAQTPRVQTSDGNGYAYVTLIPTTWTTFTLDIVADGYFPVHTTVQSADVLSANAAGLHNFFPLIAAHVDPSNIPLTTLATIRGAMWPSASGCPGLLLPFGPRPGEPDNIIATGFFANYSADQQLQIVNCIKSHGWTHVVMGPIVDSDGYHGMYAPHDWHWEDAAHLTGDNWEKFLDIAQYFWDHQLVPVVFGHPDGWTFEQTRDALTPLLQLPRAQKLIRVFVPTGWEPTRYGWSSCTWALFAQWARQTLPNAVIAIHTVNDVDAPAGSDLGANPGSNARCNDDDRGWNPQGNAGAWSRVVPFVHVWLIQNGAYKTAPSADPQLATNFAAQFQADGEGAAQHSIAWHFYGNGGRGNAGWPTTSAWGDHPIWLVNGEVTAFEGFWGNEPEAWRDAWGDTCAAQPFCFGYLDGGTKPVVIH